MRRQVIMSHSGAKVIGTRRTLLTSLTVNPECCVETLTAHIHHKGVNRFFALLVLSRLYLIIKILRLKEI